MFTCGLNTYSLTICLANIPQILHSILQLIKSVAMSRARINALLTTNDHNNHNTIHNEYMDMIQLGHVNNAYENTLELANLDNPANDREDQTFKKPRASSARNTEKIRAVPNISLNGGQSDSGLQTIPSYQSVHDYEDPSKLIPHPLLSQYSIRHKDNDLYEPTGPLQPRKAFLADIKGGKEKTESCCSRLVLGLILMVSLAALILVAMMITGFIGPGCMCANQGKNYIALLLYTVKSKK